MNKIIISLSVFAASFAAAQTGINTTVPNTTLEVVAKNTDGSTPEGVKIPQLTGDAVKAMTANLTAVQNGMIVFVTARVTTTDSATENLTKAGHYCFEIKADGTAKKWIDLEGAGELVKFADITNPQYVGYKLRDSGNLNTGAYAVNLAFKPKDTNAEFISYEGMNATYAMLFSNGNAHNSIDEVGASGLYSFAAGFGTSAKGEGSTALGWRARAYGVQATSIGSAKAEGNFSYAFGSELTKAIGLASLAIGVGNGAVADGTNSVAIGDYTFASGENSVAFGSSIDNTEATGKESIAIQGGSSSGFQSISIGTNSGSTGDKSVSIGPGAVVLNMQEIGFGVNLPTDSVQESTNYSQNEKQLFSIGNGIFREASNQPNLRSNALVILRNAKTGIGLPSDFANSKPKEMLDVNGDVLVRGNKTVTFTGAGGACTNPGAITYQNDTFYGCKTIGWVQLNN